MSNSALLSALNGVAELCMLRGMHGGVGADGLWLDAKHCQGRGAGIAGPVRTGDLVAQLAIIAVLMLVAAGAVWALKYLLRLKARRREEEAVRNAKHLVPPPRREYDLTVVLDLDETLVSFGNDAFAKDGSRGVRTRPMLKEFLELLKEEENIEVIVWTAATRAYSKCVHETLQSLVPGFVNYRIHRTNAWFDDNDHVKDLRLLGRDMSKVLMVENRPASGRLQAGNTILVPDFVHRAKNKAPPHDPSLGLVKDLIREFLRAPQPVPKFLASTQLAQRVSADK
eukprot:gene20362-31324_t